MPIFEFICIKCGHQFEVLVQGAQQPKCPACGGTNLTKQFSVPAVGRGKNSGSCGHTHGSGGG